MNTFAPDNTDFRLLRENPDGTGYSVQIDAFQVVLDTFNNQIMINLTQRQIDQISIWGWRRDGRERNDAKRLQAIRAIEDAQSATESDLC